MVAARRPSGQGERAASRALNVVVRTVPLGDHSTPRSLLDCLPGSTSLNHSRAPCHRALTKPAQKSARAWPVQPRGCIRLRDGRHAFSCRVRACQSRQLHAPKSTLTFFLSSSLVLALRIIFSRAHNRASHRAPFFAPSCAHARKPPTETVVTPSRKAQRGAVAWRARARGALLFLPPTLRRKKKKDHDWHAHANAIRFFFYFLFFGEIIGE